MKQHPTERELDSLLAELPRESAPSGFSRRVFADLADLAASPRRRAGRRWLLPAAAAAAALTAGLWLLPWSTQEPPRLEKATLEQEHRLLMEELESLKASLRQSQAAPVLYLGGDERLDLVLDLGPVWQGAGSVRTAADGGSARPPVATDRSGDRR